MGKSTKPTVKWFKAVKKAFRSPSKERPSPQDKNLGRDTAGDDEKLLGLPTEHVDFPPVSYPGTTTPRPPEPLFQNMNNVDTAHSNKLQAPTQQDLCTCHHGPPSPPPPSSSLATDAAAVKISATIRVHDHTDKKVQCHEGDEPPERQQRLRTSCSCDGNLVNRTVYGVESKHREDDDGSSSLSEEEEAAARIQQRFRSSAVAMKGLVRLQALVRGQLVRRQAATTLRTTEAIVRVQALFRGRRVRASKDGRVLKTKISQIRRLSSRASAAGVVVEPGDARRDDFQEMEPETSEARHEANKRKRRTAYLLTQQLKTSTPNRSSSFIDCYPDKPHEGWAWLEVWTNAKPWDNNTTTDPNSNHRHVLLQSKEVDSDSKDPKDYIEIIPGQSSRKEVDISTLKMKNYDSACVIMNATNPVLGGTNEFDEAGVEEDEEEADHGSSAFEKKSPGKLTPPSPAASEDVVVCTIAVSPGGSDAPVSVADPSTGVDSSPGIDDRTMAMEPELHGANGSEHFNDSAAFSTSNGVQHHGASDTVMGTEDPGAVDVANGTTSNNGHEQEHSNGDNKTSCKQKDETTPSPSPGGKRTPPCRYMTATESAKAKFRSASNPKTSGGSPTSAEGAQIPAAPVKQWNSLGGSTNGILGKAVPVESPSKGVAFGTRKTTTTTSNGVQNNRRSPSPKTGGAAREKARSVDAAAPSPPAGISPARRISVGAGDSDKRWRT